MDLDDIVNWFKERGIEVKRKWGPEGGCDNISIFGIGRYYEGNYKGFRFIFSRSTEDSGLLLGFIVRLYYSQPYQLGLTCTYNISAFSSMTYRLYQGKDIMANKFDSGIKGLKCWAVKKDIAKTLFQQEKVATSINTLKYTLNIPEESGVIKQVLVSPSGLWIDDRGIGVFISAENDPAIFRNIIDTMFEFCSAVDDFARSYGSRLLKPGNFQIVVNRIVIALLILVLFCTIWIIISSF